jgi:hypothetical protein
LYYFLIAEALSITRICDFAGVNVDSEHRFGLLLNATYQLVV